MKLQLTDSRSVGPYRPDGPITPDPKQMSMALKIGNYKKMNKKEKSKSKRKDIKIKIFHSSRCSSKQEII